MNLRSFVFAGAIVAGISGVSMADVTGKINFDGKAPKPRAINMAAVPACASQHKGQVFEESVVIGKGGELANVIVSIKEPPKSDKKSAEPTLDQKGCQYSPHVVGLMVGQKITVKNSDPFLHNVHGLPENNPGFNFGQNNVDEKGKPTPAMKEVEYFRVKCDVHPWMSAFVGVFNHPFFAVSKADGTFAIKDLPDGEYDVVAWHEKFGEQEGKVSVKGGKGEINFTFKPEEEANATPTLDVKTLTLSTSANAGKAAEGCESCCEKEKTAGEKAVASASAAVTAAPAKK